MLFRSRGSVRELDAGRASYLAPDGSEAEAYFANFAGAGISGAIARRANVTSKALGGKLSFMWATLVVFSRWRSAAITVEIDGEQPGTTPARFEIVPRALRIRVPPDAN